MHIPSRTWSPWGACLVLQGAWSDRGAVCLSQQVKILPSYQDFMLLLQPVKGNTAPGGSGSWQWRLHVPVL